MDERRIYVGTAYVVGGLLTGITGVCVGIVIYYSFLS